MKRLLAHWCYINNFGDALNPYILSALSGRKVKYVNYKSPNYIRELIKFTKNLARFKKYDFNRLIPPFWYRKRDVILGIGSVISRSLPNHKVWGSGYMNNYKEPLKTGGTFYAVRGRYTSEKLNREGYPKCQVYGDPALLLPLIYTPLNKNVYRIGLVPHIKDLADFRKNYYSYNVIDLITSTENSVEDIIDNIVSCQYIVSTSLHGIIVAHAYGIPAVWVKKNDIDTDGMKFYDYFDSVDIPPYEGFTDLPSIIDSPESFFKHHENIVLPRVEIGRLQKELLRVAPFEIIEKFRIFSK